MPVVDEGLHFYYKAIRYCDFSALQMKYDNLPSVKHVLNSEAHVCYFQRNLKFHFITWYQYHCLSTFKSSPSYLRLIFEGFYVSVFPPFLEKFSFDTTTQYCTLKDKVPQCQRKSLQITTEYFVYHQLFRYPFQFSFGSPK